MATNFSVIIGEIGLFAQSYLWPWHSQTECNIAILIFRSCLLDLAEISTELFGAITTQFCFTYMLEGVIGMPRGLHARLCHAFRVIYLMTVIIIVSIIDRYLYLLSSQLR